MFVLLAPRRHPDLKIRLRRLPFVKISGGIDMSDWQPSLYLEFGQERTQPSIDLVTRIDHENPTRIIDIGCGPGNSTQVL